MKQILDKNGHEIIVKFNARITKKSQSLIDLISTNQSERVICHALSNHKISDHETISININKICKTVNVKKTILSWKNYDKDKLIFNLRNCDWSNLFKNNFNISDKINISRNNLTVSVNPLINEVQINDKIKPTKWFDSELSVLKKERDIKYNECKNNRCDNAWQNYINIRNKYNKTIKIKKNEYTQKEIRNAGNNQKLMWKCLNKIISNKKKKRAMKLSLMMAHAMIQM